MISYHTYKRPLSYYVNLCGRNKLYVQEIAEVPYRTKRAGKIRKTTIPGLLVVKAIKR